jgi:hypothetical protein
MSHGKTECKECGKVIMSCRCMEAHKEVTYVVCEDCKAKRKPAPKRKAGA